MRTRITIVLAVLCACRDQSTVTVVAEPIRAEPVVLDFGSAFVGYEAQAEAVLSNPNKTPVEVALSLEGAAFTLPAQRVTVEGGVALRLKLVFHPQGPGAASGTLTANGRTIDLKGTGVAVPDCGSPPLCHSIAFDAKEGRCVPTALAEGSICTASAACFSRAECHQGQCLGVLDTCDDDDKCTLDACGTSGCAHAPKVCPASADPCQSALCVPALGCTTEPVADGTACGVNDCHRARICIDGTCVSRPVPVMPVCSAWEQESYLKAANSGAGDAFGHAVAISGDGKQLAVSAWYEDANDANAPQNNSAFESGAVYVYAKAGLDWVPTAFLKASNAGTGDRFGSAIAFSADGSTLAIGADGEDGSGLSPGSNAAPGAGAAYVFKRAIDGSWYQQAYLKATQSLASDSLGSAIAISANGSTVVAGMPGRAQLTGAVQVWEQTGAGWTPSAPIAPSGFTAGDLFGNEVAISGDGNTIAAGAPLTGGQAGIVRFFKRAGGWADHGFVAMAVGQQLGGAVALSHDGKRAAVSSRGANHVVIHDFTTVWTLAGIVTPSNPTQYSGFGDALALSADGQTLVVGSPREDTAGTDSGSAYVFSLTSTLWAQLKMLKARNADPGDLFGGAVAISNDGVTVVVGAVGESSAATTVDGDEKNNTATYAGAAYVF